MTHTSTACLSTPRRPAGAARVLPALLAVGLGLALVGGGLGLALLGGGCASRERTQTRSGLTATYAFRTLSTELDPTVSVLTATAAAEQALRSRGYSIAKSEATEDSAVIVGRPARGGDFDRAVVESRVTKTGTSIAVRIEPFGNEAASYAIMDSLLMRMGR